MANNKNEQVADENKLAEITETLALIKIEGQEFELEAELAREDNILKTVLQPHFASVENANITREVNQGRLEVTIVKRAQHKGGIKAKRADLTR